MSIRLICSDIDGTLLQYGKKELSGEIFEQIRELHRRGILFCPASGRQYTSLRKLFAPVADCCVFLCQNGGVLYKDKQCIAKNPMPRALAEEIANDLWNNSNGQGEVMISGQNMSFCVKKILPLIKMHPVILIAAITRRSKVNFRIAKSDDGVRHDGFRQMEQFLLGFYPVHLRPGAEPDRTQSKLLCSKTDVLRSNRAVDDPVILGQAECAVWLAI